jgi:hypothetical protein
VTSKIFSELEATDDDTDEANEEEVDGEEDNKELDTPQDVKTTIAMVLKRNLFFIT